MTIFAKRMKLFVSSPLIGVLISVGILASNGCCSNAIDNHDLNHPWRRGLSSWAIDDRQSARYHVSRRHARQAMSYFSRTSGELLDRWLMGVAQEIEVEANRRRVATGGGRAQIVFTTGAFPPSRLTAAPPDGGMKPAAAGGVQPNGRRKASRPIVFPGTTSSVQQQEEVDLPNRSTLPIR